MTNEGNAQKGVYMVLVNERCFHSIPLQQLEVGEGGVTYVFCEGMGPVTLSKISVN
jgi:hypothetical protein